MSKQSGVSPSKSSKETQEEGVKQAQSQQYRHQNNILDITLLPPPSTLYLIHTPMQSPHFNSKQTNADIAVIFLALEFKQNLRKPTVKWISHSQTKFTYPKFDTKSLSGASSTTSHKIFTSVMLFGASWTTLHRVFICAIWHHWTAKTLQSSEVKNSQKSQTLCQPYCIAPRDEINTWTNRHYFREPSLKRASVHGN